MRKYFMCVLGLVMVLGFVGMSSAAIVTDPTGDLIGSGPTDITAARAEQETRTDGVTVLKVSYTATPNIGGIMVFEADVDSNTATGGSLSMTGIPVSPCPCKTTAGIDVVVMVMNRDQAATSNSAMCAGCSDSTAASCARKRWYGEWYAVASGTGTTDTTGYMRGFLDPTTFYTQATNKSYTFPWDTILLRGNYELPPAEQYVYADALNPADTRWQLSVWTDPTFADEDDFANGASFFGISDVIPNGDGNLVPSVDVANNLTFCEGNFDNDIDVDGWDASKFKTDFGRARLCASTCEGSGFCMSACAVCPNCSPSY